MMRIALTEKIKSNRGFSLVELMLAGVLMVALFGIILMTLTTGQDSWDYTRTEIELRESLRKSIQRVSRELRETGSDDTGASQLIITQAGGSGTSDALRFAVPILCDDTMSLIDAEGDVAVWGAPLTWGCADSSCMDADNDCSTRDYRYVEYLLNAGNQLVRRVIDNSGTAVSTVVFAENITDFQVTFNGEDENLNCVINGSEDANGNGVLDGGTNLTLTATGSLATNTGRQITSSVNVDVHIRNRGCSQ